MFPLVTPEAQSNAGFEPEIGFSVREVTDEQWSIVAWLWQSYRHDLALVVNGLPYADGRYQTAVLNEYPMADGAGYLAWRPHPKSGEDAPIGFAVIKGLKGERRSIEEILRDLSHVALLPRPHVNLGDGSNIKRG